MSNHQKIFEVVFSLLESRPFVMLANIGERVQGLLEPDEKLRAVLESHEDLEIIQDSDPEKRARIAVHKKGDINAKDKFSHGIQQGSPSDLIRQDDELLRSILCAFTLHLTTGKKVIIQNKFPYKFRITDIDFVNEEYIDVDPSLIIDKGGNLELLTCEEKSLLFENIKRWADSNHLNIETMLLKKKKQQFTVAKDSNTQTILLNFIKSQPAEIQKKIIFPSEFICFLFDNR